MEKKTRIYFDSRCRNQANASAISLDLRKPLFNVTNVNVLQATVPVYSVANWQQESKHVAIRINGFYRRDIEESLPVQMPSDVVAILPLATATPGAFAYTFYMESIEAGLWRSANKQETRIPRVDRLDVSLLEFDPTAVPTSLIAYPLADMDFTVAQNWTAVIEISHAR